MAWYLLTLCLVALTQAQNRVWNVAQEQKLQRLGASKESLSAICEQICPNGQTMAPYPGACNMYIWCVETQLTIYVQQCPQGTLYSDFYKTCVPLHFVRDSDPCSGDRDICKTKARMPDKNGCKYHMCEGSTIVEKTCERGLGFDVPTGQCNEQARQYCVESRYKELEATCQPLGKDNESYNRTVTRYIDVSGVERNELVTYTRQCPAGLWYPPEINNCSCVRKPEREVVCRDVQLVDLSSARDTWTASHLGAPDLYKLEGNLTLDNNGQAYVTMSDLHVPALTKNELGGRWNLSLTFTVGAKRADGVFQPGFPSSANTQAMALVDNSVCSTPATFGCYLRRVGMDASIVCFANDHEMASTNVNVARPLTVTLSRVESLGRMVVSSQGQRLDEKSFQFGEQEQVQINECPLTIGYSLNQQDFSGYMDEINLFKYACN